jgi:hypothetical protein
MDPEDMKVVPDFTEKVEVPKVALQLVFDALCQSLDFGSGFLDDEDVEGLRAVAVALGVDPMVATPADWVHRYPHVYKGNSRGLCADCRRSMDMPCHQGVTAPNPLEGGEL